MQDTFLKDLSDLTHTTSMEVAWPMFQTQLARFGFDQVLYAFTQFRTANQFGNPSDAIILSNLSSEYLDVFLGENLYMHAPTVQWVSDSPMGAISWGEARKALAAGDLTQEQAKVLAFNEKHGLKAGYTIAFPAVSSRSKGGVGISVSDASQEEVDQIWADHGERIELLCSVAHLKFSDLPYTAGRRLTERQRMALEMVADGKTTLDIATIWGRNTATVEKHLRLAREALEVETTAQAIHKASFLNQFFHISAS